MSVNYRNILSAAVCAVALCACSDDSNDVVVERADPNADFTSYKTFAISDQTNNAASIPSSVTANLGTANDAIAAQLEDQGLTQVDLSADPDVVAFSLASTDETAALSWSCVPGYWYGYWDWSYDPCSVVAPYYDTYEVGTLVVGLVDPALNKVVFGGVAQSILDNSNVTDDINNAVADIFDSYPANQTGSN